MSTPTSCFVPISAASGSCCRLELEFHAFRVLPSTARLFLDIGANDGISARSFRLFNKTTPILSIEANPCHEPALKRTKAALDSFDYKLVAAGERRGQLVLHTPVFRGIALTAYAAMDRSEAERRVRHDMPSSARRLRFIETVVPVIPIDDLALTPDFVKIDVEGFELEVLRGMVATIERCSPIFMIERRSRKCGGHSRNSPPISDIGLTSSTDMPAPFVLTMVVKRTICFIFRRSAKIFAHHRSQGVMPD